MEVSLLAMLLLLGIDTLDRGSPPQAGLALGLASITRPESLALVPLFILHLFLKAPRNRQNMLKGLTSLLLPALFLFSGWSIYNLAVSGFPLPSTSIKASGQLIPQPSHLVWFLGQVRESFSFSGTAVAACLYLLGSVALIKTDWRSNASIVAIPWLFLLALSSTHQTTSAWVFYFARYFHPMWPFLALPIFSFPLFLKRLDDSLRTKLKKFSICCALLAMAIFMAGPFMGFSTLYSKNCRDIRIANVAVGKWLKEKTSPGDWIATMDAGAIRFFSQRNVLDIVGLNNVVLAEAWRRNPSGFQQARLDQIRRVNPRFFVLFPTQYPDIIYPLGLTQVARIVNDDYSIGPFPSQQKMVIYASPASTRN